MTSPSDDLAVCASMLAAASTATGEVRVLYIGEARQAYQRAAERLEALRIRLDAAEQEMVRVNKGAER